MRPTANLGRAINQPSLLPRPLLPPRDAATPLPSLPSCADWRRQSKFQKRFQRISTSLLRVSAQPQSPSLAAGNVDGLLLLLLFDCLGPLTHPRLQPPHHLLLPSFLLLPPPPVKICADAFLAGRRKRAERRPRCPSPLETTVPLSTTTSS